MFCPACGAKSDDGAKFCRKCGAPFDSAPIPRDEPTPAAPKRRKFSLLRVLTIVVVLIVGFFALVFINARFLEKNSSQVGEETLITSMPVLDFPASNLAQLDTAAARATNTMALAAIKQDLLAAGGTRQLDTLRYYQCADVFLTSDHRAGLSNSCDHPLEVVFCATSALAGHTAAPFSCETGNFGRVTLAANGSIATNMQNASSFQYGGCNAFIGSPDSVASGSGGLHFDCYRWKKQPVIVAVGGREPEISTADPGTPARLDDCRALATARSLQGDARSEFLAACTNLESIPTAESR